MAANILRRHLNFVVFSYRFITRYSDEPDTCFPESVFRRISDMPPNWASCAETKDLSENIVNGFKTPVKSADFFLSIFSNKRLTSSYVLKKMVK